MAYVCNRTLFSLIMRILFRFLILMFFSLHGSRFSRRGAAATKSKCQVRRGRHIKGKSHIIVFTAIFFIKKVIVLVKLEKYIERFTQYIDNTPQVWIDHTEPLVRTFYASMLSLCSMTKRL